MDHEGEVLEVLSTKRRECGRWLHNRVENSHQTFQRREGTIARIRGIKALQEITAAHASVHNHFNRHGYLDRRNTSKETRSAALAEWRRLTA